MSDEQSKHTPGPWVHVTSHTKCRYDADYLRSKIWTSKGPGHGTIADASDIYNKPGEVEANARLIAAAPKLLVALRKCKHLAEREMIALQSTEFDHGATARYESVVEAIAEAEGKN